MDMQAFVKERDEALLSLDKNKILEYCKKYSVPIPDDEEVFWAGIHKARIHTNSIPLDAKLDSCMWLGEHGFRWEIN